MTLTVIVDLAPASTPSGLLAELDQIIAPSVGLTDDIYTTEYHPHSTRDPERQNFTEYSKQRSSHPPISNAELWRPFFNTCEDFEFAEILMEAGVNKGQSDRLLKLFRKCLSGDGTLTYSNYSEIQSSWEHAAPQLTPVSFITIPQEWY